MFVEEVFAGRRGSLSGPAACAACQDGCRRWSNRAVHDDCGSSPHSGATVSRTVHDATAWPGCQPLPARGRGVFAIAPAWGVIDSKPHRIEGALRYVTMSPIVRRCGKMPRCRINCSPQVAARFLRSSEQPNELDEQNETPHQQSAKGSLDAHQRSHRQKPLISTAASPQSHRSLVSTASRTHAKTTRSVLNRFTWLLE